MLTADRPTRVRYAVIGVTAFAAFLMYLDRMCMSQIINAETFHRDLKLTASQVATVQSVFFFAYALAQMPAGWLGDRFSARPLLTLLIAIWSGFTLLTGFSVGLWSLVFARIGCGLAEAGAYPASGSLVPRWAPLDGRGRASATIAGGGRLGGAVAPALTALAIATLGGWRVPGWIFGGVGVVFAGVFWVVCRDRPADHPGCNATEREFIEGTSPGGSSSVLSHDSRKIRVPIPWAGLLCSRDMWLMCVYQFLTNVGWVFLVTDMPLFLKNVTHLSENASGKMATIALLIGLGGMLGGGWLTDVLTRRYGRRQGRMIPLAWSRVIGAAAYLICLRFTSPWVCVISFGLVAAMTDISIPACWGYIQDVGGRSVAAVYAWPNMWGNFGAALTPKMLEWINRTFDPAQNWHASLIFLAVAFLLSGVVALWIRADITITPGEGQSGDRQPGFPVALAPAPVE